MPFKSSSKMNSMKKNGVLLIILIFCSPGAMSQVIKTSGGPLFHPTDTTSIYSGKSGWNLSRIAHTIKDIENIRLGCTDSVYVLVLDTMYRELKSYIENRANYALLDKQINFLNLKLEKAWRDSYQRSTPYGLVRKEILAGKPDETDRLILDGMGYREDNKPDKEYACFKKGLENDSNRLNNYFFVIIDELEFTRDTVKALYYLNKVISRSNGKNVTSFNPYLTRAWVYASMKQYNQSFADLNKVLEKDPDNQEALYNRGYLKQKLNDYQGSVSDFQQLLKCIQSKPFRVDAESAMLLNNIGWNYYLLKEYKLCAEYGCQSLLLKPDDSYALDTRGSGYFGLGEYEKCIDDMTKAVGLNPDLANSWRLRGLSYLKLNRQDQACTDLSKAAALGDTEAVEAMKGLCLPPTNTDGENQRKFSVKKIPINKNRLRMDAYGIYYRL